MLGLTQHIDLAQIALYAFWLFFAGLILYLLRENKREGYPLVALDRAGVSPVLVEGFPPVPPPKSFLLADGREVLAPRDRAEPPVRFAHVGRAQGSPVMPVGNALTAGVGPGAWAARLDVPDHAFDDEKPKIVPLRAAPAFFLATEDPNPIGFDVVGADDLVAGKVVDVWIDRSEVLMRYAEIELSLGEPGRRVLMPNTVFDIDARERRLICGYVRAAQFAMAPVTKHPDQVTLLEEDMIMGFYAAGTLFAWPGRAEPVL